MKKLVTTRPSKDLITYPPYEHLVQRNAQCPEVYCEAITTAEGNLWRHIRCGAAELIRHVWCLGEAIEGAGRVIRVHRVRPIQRENLGQSEVCNHEVAVRVDQY